MTFPPFDKTAWVVFVAVLMTATGGRSAHAQETPSGPDLESLFPHRADIFVDSSGLARLFLPPEILAECQPQLSDLRIVDQRGREVPYWIDGGLAPDATLEERIVFEPQLLSTSRHTEEREFAPNLLSETYHLSLPVGEPRNWDLVIESRSPQFVRKLMVAAAKSNGDENTLTTDSLFRLQLPSREKLRAALPLFEADTLAVTLEGEEEFFLEPSFRLEVSRTLPEREQVRVDLAIRKSRSEYGRTVVELDRPRGLVPDQLTVSTATGSFSRRFEVWDQGPGSDDGPLGGATLYRLESIAGVEQTNLDLAQAHGDGLKVVIDDGDSPPLEQLAFQAVLRRPSLVFSSTNSSPDQPAAALFYGGARAFRPRYDLAGLFPEDRRSVSGDAARIGVELRDSDSLGLARLGPSLPNPRWDPAPALAFAMRPGSKIATWPFEYRRTVSVPQTREGLLRLGLEAETVARSRPDLADLRLVDAQSRQWPYLVDRTGTKERVSLAVRAPETNNKTSTYFLDLPSKPLPIAQLVLDGPAPYFDRRFELFAVSSGKATRKRMVSRGRLLRRPEDPREITIELDGGPWTALELRIQNEDDAPLSWSSVEATVPMPDLYFAAPQGDYSLLFGSPEARPPRYELEKVRDLVLAVDSTRVVAGNLVDNPGRGLFSRSRGDGGWQQILLWSALGLAALVLAWITLRLARQDSN